MSKRKDAPISEAAVRQTPSVDPDITILSFARDGEDEIFEHARYLGDFRIETIETSKRAAEAVANSKHGTPLWITLSNSKGVKIRIECSSTGDGGWHTSKRQVTWRMGTHSMVLLRDDGEFKVRIHRPSNIDDSKYYKLRGNTMAQFVGKVSIRKSQQDSLERLLEFVNRIWLWQAFAHCLAIIDKVDEGNKPLTSTIEAAHSIIDSLNVITAGDVCYQNYSDD